MFQPFIRRGLEEMWVAHKHFCFDILVECPCKLGRNLENANPFIMYVDKLLIVE